MYTSVSVGETRVVFSKLGGPLPTPVPITDSKPEPQSLAPVGETITLKKAENSAVAQTLVDKDKSPPKKEPSAEVLPSESWVIVKPEVDTQDDQSEPKEKLSTDKDNIPDQPATSNVEPETSDVKQAWNGSSSEQDSASVAQPPPGAAPSSSGGGTSGGVGKDIEVEDIEEGEVKEEGVSDAISNAVFTFGELEEEEPEEKFSTPSAATPQVSIM